MLAVKSMDVRDNFKSLCDKVFNGETLDKSTAEAEAGGLITKTIAELEAYE